jgi:hypothetical protein
MFFYLNVAVNVQWLIIDTETQQWVLFALLSIYKIFRNAINKRTYLGLHVKCPQLLSDFKEIRNFQTDFHESPLSSFNENRPVGASLMHADSGTGK